MTIYSDAIGNKFLGDCIWANHNITYPTTKFLQAQPLNSFSSELTALCTQSGLQFRDIVPQANIDSNISGFVLAFSANGDTIDDRYVMGNSLIWTNNSGGSSSSVGIFNDGGFTGTVNSGAISGTNSQVNVGNNGVGSGANYNAGSLSSVFQYPVSDNFYQMPYVAGVSDGQSLALLITQYDFTNNRYRTNFMYAGLLADVNTGDNYYSLNNVTKSIALTFTGNVNISPIPSTPIIVGGHYIGVTAKRTLFEGDAIYPIVCSQGGPPTSQWATDMYVFDNDSSLGFPAIGRVRNLLLATGSYTIGKPVKIEGALQPDAGSNRWIPVGSYAGKTVLMRCYSSVNI